MPLLMRRGYQDLPNATNPSWVGWNGRATGDAQSWSCGRCARHWTPPSKPSMPIWTGLSNVQNLTPQEKNLQIGSECRESSLGLSGVEDLPRRCQALCPQTSAEPPK